MRAGFTNEVDFQHIALVQLFMGIGVALFFMPTLSILMSDLPPSQIADGSGLATFLRTLGGSFAASLTTWIWIRRADQHHAYLSESITPSTRRPARHCINWAGQGQGLRRWTRWSSARRTSCPRWTTSRCWAGCSWG
jgi:DHA2 family multidrug resistance protein